MIDFTPTSRLRRKLKTKVATLQSRLQTSKVFGSFQDLTSLDRVKIKDRVRKFKCSSSDVDDYDSDEFNQNTLEYREYSVSSTEINTRLSLEDGVENGNRLNLISADSNLLDRLGEKCNHKFRRVIIS
ncbi:hypothetical protein Trydic_g23729 [Trypoxylus dichotomus]